MIDKLIGTDEEIKNDQKRGKPRGGELVEIDAFNSGSTATDATNTAGAQAAGHIAQTASETGGDDDESSYGEEYENDFHEILEEVVRHQADLEEDRDDDPDLNESDSILPNLSEEESKGDGNGRRAGASSETTQEPHESATDSVTKKRVAATSANSGQIPETASGGDAGDEMTAMDAGGRD